jgi:hypothetical protein
MTDTEMQKGEEEALNSFSRITSEEHALKMEISLLLGSSNRSLITKVEEELRPIIQKRIKLHGEYLQVKLNSAIHVRDSMRREYGAEPEAYESILAPIFDGYVWEAQDALDRFKKKYLG